MRARNVDHLDSGIAEECAAYLRGEYAAWVVREGLPIRPATFLNLAAHGDRDAVAAHVEEHGLPDHPRTFADAGLLVEAMLLAADDFDEVQRAVVAPVELALVRQVVSPRAVVARVADALFAAEPPATAP